MDLRVFDYPPGNDHISPFKGNREDAKNPRFITVGFVMFSPGGVVVQRVSLPR